MINTATVDSDSLRKISREKFHTKINTPRARKRTTARGRKTRVQHTAEKNLLVQPRGVVGQIIYYLTLGVLGACRQAPHKFKDSYGGGSV
jgi:hypothetical protein